MKVYVSAHGANKEAPAEFEKYFESVDSDLTIASSHFSNRSKKSTKSIIDFADEEMSDADLLVVLWSKGAYNSKSAHSEVRAMKMLSDVHPDKSLLIFTEEGSRLPIDLSATRVWEFKEFDKKFFRYAEGVIAKSLEASHLEDGTSSERSDEQQQSQIEMLRKAHADGKLTLVCGAGISIGAGIPPWGEMLNRLLDAMVLQLSSKGAAPAIPQSELGQIKESSSLIVGRYIKNVLQEDFESEVRNALYRNSDQGCDIIDSIVELARPRRSSAHLDSIITFNFDDLLEKNFERASISYHVIASEGARPNANELPIYHVHGYLPKTGQIPKDTNLVFSEDTYHDQFVDPFSWSNLTQLNKFSQNTCLFVGLSMTDPNLRRLMDVSNRRDGDNGSRHYVIFKRENLNSKSRMVEGLREQDAASLGLSIIWVNEYAEIPKFIDSVAKL